MKTSAATIRLLLICWIGSTLALGSTFASAASSQTPEGVGFTRSKIENPGGGKLDYAIWYPANTPTETTQVGPYEFDSTQEAPPADGSFGLVALSHGSGGTPFGHRNIAIALARAGFIAVAPLHPLDNFRDDSGVGHRVVWEGRPRQISAIVDHMLAEPQWAARIDKERIGAFGFSMGGYTVLALSGAQPDLRELIRHCDTNAGADPLCAKANGLANAMRDVFKDEYQEPPRQLADKRICAAVIADPLAAIFSNDAVSEITVRALKIYMPERENEVAGRFHGGRVAEILAENPDISVDLHLIPDAQHYSFIAPFPKSLEKRLPAFFKNDPEFDAKAFHAKFASEVVEFFTRELHDCAS